METVRIHKGVVAAIVALCALLAITSLVVLTMNRNPSPRSLANAYIKQCEMEDPDIDFRLREIERIDDTTMVIYLDYRREGMPWSEYAWGLRIVYYMGEWQADE